MQPDVVSVNRGPTLVPWCEIGFASQRQYVSVYLLRTDVRDAFADRLADQDMGKGCLRFRKAIDYELVQDLLRATADTNGPIC